MATKHNISAEEPPEVSSLSSGVSSEETPDSLKRESGHKRYPKRRGWRIARRLVQVGALLLYSLPLILVGWNLFGTTAGAEARILTPADLPFFGSLSSSSIAGIDLMDPYAALQVALASKEFSLGILLAVLPILLFYALIRARAFCGWFCPVNFILEGIDFLRTKLGIKVQERVLPRRTKIFVAVAVLLISALVSIPIFEVFSPISFINKGIIAGSTVGLLVFIAIVVIELFWGHRVWCRALCPLGGFYEVLGRVGFVNVRIEQEACIHCGICQDTCLADPEILQPALDDTTTAVLAGDCMLCGECVDNCPTKALSIKVGLDHYRSKSQKAPHKSPA